MSLKILIINKNNFLRFTGPKIHGLAATALINIFLGIVWVPTDVQAIDKKPMSGAWLRVKDNISHLKVSPNGRYAAYINERSQSLRVIDLASKNIYQAATQIAQKNFFWSPGGHRLFFRKRQQVDIPGKENSKTNSKAIISNLMAYDAYLHKRFELRKIPSNTGHITFDPRSNRLHILTEKTLMSHRLIFPESRLAKWQTKTDRRKGQWVVAPNGILWATLGGRDLKKLHDDGSPVESFSISPDGTSIAWATEYGRVYLSTDGNAPQIIGYGRDPIWHPNKSFIIYAAASIAGNRVSQYDLKAVSKNGKSKWITRTPHSSERWPTWINKTSQMMFTKEKTTDIYLMDFKL